MKNLIFTMMLVLIAGACKKNNSNSNSSNTTQSKAYLKFKVDGVAYQFNSGFTNIDTDIKVASFSFNDGNTSNLLTFTLALGNIDDVNLKSYTMTKTGTNGMEFIKTKTDPDNNTYAVYKNSYAGNATIVITKMKSTGPLTKAINGTFTAKMYNKNGGSILITDGEFFNPLTN